MDFIFCIFQDLRKKEVGTTFNGKSESVRDVLFSPFNYFVFAAAHENGNVQVAFPTFDMNSDIDNVKAHFNLPNL